MRRALLLAAVVLPIVALAAAAANVGQVVETTNFDGVNNYINAAQCAGTTPVHLEWNIQPVSGSFSGTGLYKVFASSQQPSTTTGTTGTFCAETASPNATTPVYAGQVDAVTASTAVQDKDVSGATIIQVVNASGATGICGAGNEGKTLWVCTHWFDANSNRAGFATGKFVLQVQAPADPVSVGGDPGDGAIDVHWSAPTGTGAQLDHYIATATPSGGGTPVSSGETNALKVRIAGLTNGVAYTVTVTAYSKGGNPSNAVAASEPVTPGPVEDYWDWYKLQGGTETGGCASGSAGALALAGVAALLAIRRRSK